MGRIKEAIRKWKLARKSPSEVFAAYYRDNKWGDAETRSGKGSSLEATKELREKLPALVLELGIDSFLDLPCGGHFWMAQTKLGVARCTGVTSWPK